MKETRPLPPLLLTSYRYDDSDQSNWKARLRATYHQVICRRCTSIFPAPAVHRATRRKESLDSIALTTLVHVVQSVESEHVFAFIRSMLQL